MRSRLAILLVLVAPPATAQVMQEDPPAPTPVWEEFLRLRARLEALEKQQAGGGVGGSIDLSGEEVTLPDARNDHILARPWFENVELNGFAALTYLDSGGVGTTPDGSFLVREASLFLQVEIWEDVFFFSEVWLNRYLFGSGLTLGEIFLWHRDLFGCGPDQAVGLKVGRFEVPFGEDYLIWDAHESPYINFAAADPYGLDEGVQLHGALGPVQWIGSLMNGGGGSGDDASGMMATTKLSLEPLEHVYVSASGIHTGSTSGSDFFLSGARVAPVAGSPSSKVKGTLWELDVHLFEGERAEVKLQYGRGRVDDEANAFDRDLTWYQIAPRVRLCQDVDLVGRVSAVGTFDSDQGYAFRARHVANAMTLGSDLRSLTRYSGGLLWRIHPHYSLKLEVGKDHVDLIDGSPMPTNNDERLFFGIEVVGSF